MASNSDLIARCNALLQQFLAEQISDSVVREDRHVSGATAIAAILAQWGATQEMICAALLEPLLAAGQLSQADIELSVGEDIVRLTSDYRALLSRKSTYLRRGTGWSQSLTTLFVAAYQDPRLAILAAADRWQHCIPIDETSAAVNHSTLSEAQSVLAPLLGMLGMWNQRKALETWLASQPQDGEPPKALTETPEQTERVLRTVRIEIEQTLSQAMPGAQLSSRHQPTVRGEQRPGTLDRLSLDLLVDSEADCYRALYLIHRHWRPAEGAIHDYVGASKVNGYRCLRTSVIVIHSGVMVRVSFHILTGEMDEINNWGVAAVCMRGQLRPPLPQAWWNQRQETYARLCAAEPGSLPDTLAVFSPQGQVFSFQRGCTVVDYAYQVHSELANQTVRFLINDEVVNPTSVLHHLDLVELEQDVGAPGPTPVWLTAARTGRARFHIDRFLKRRGGSSDAGQRILDSRLETLEAYYGFRLPKHRMEQALIQAARRLNLTTPESLLAGFANGSIAPDKLLHPLFSDEIVRQVELPPSLRLYPHQIKLGQCCRPRLGEAIEGRLRFKGDQAYGITVHRTNCKAPERLDHKMPLRWRLRPQLNAIAELDIVAVDEAGLLGQALQAVYARLPDVTLREVSATSYRGTAHISFTIEATGEEPIQSIVSDLETLPNYRIESVRHMRPSFYVLERLNRSNTPLSHNPYSRLPVREREMLFGRSEELDWICESLRDSSNIVYLRGRKRVGKTSILWHLRDFYLDRSQFMACFIDLQLLGSLANGVILHHIANAVYHDLQRDGRLGEVAPPLRDLFEESPADQFASYLQYIQTQCAPRRLVLLIDEFSVAMDAYRAGNLPADFFYHWRGILQATSPNVAYVIVVQQRAFEAAQMQQPGRDSDPSWQVLELGKPLLLKPLSDKDTRSLIERPTRNYLTYAPEALNRAALLTGPSPFIVQAFCHALVQHMAEQAYQSVSLDDVECVAEQFMGFNETLFDHALLGAGSQAFSTCATIAHLTGNANLPVALEDLIEALPTIEEPDMRRTLQSLCEQGILSEATPRSWQFASLLFKNWINHNAPDSHLTTMLIAPQ